MRHTVFTEQVASSYEICLLVPEIQKAQIEKAYFDNNGVNKNDVLVLDLHRSPVKKKTPVAEMTEYIVKELTPVLTQMDCQYLLVADSEYFKVLTKCPKVEANLGYVLDSHLGPWKVIYVPNYKTLYYDPEKNQQKVNQGISALLKHKAGQYSDPGEGIIHHGEYPESVEDIRVWLQKLLDLGKPLAADIEGYSLKHHACGIGTISFAWSKHEGIAFPVDSQRIVTGEINDTNPDHTRTLNEPVRELLRWFFHECYKRKIKLMWHNISFDVYVLIYQLYMEDILDTAGLLIGMEILLDNWDCTKLVTYLATNSTAGNKLGLKEQAQEFTGNYAEDDIKDINLIPFDRLLEYNLKDALATWHTYDRHWHTLVADDQLEIYQTIFQPAIKDIIQMQLTGLPVNMATVWKVKAELEADEAKAVTAVQSSPLIQAFIHGKNEAWVIHKNNTLKKKRVTIDDAKEEFNPASSLDCQKFLFEYLGLPVIGLTKNGQPETGKETLLALKNHTKKPDVIAVLDALIDFKAVEIILSTFIPPLVNAIKGKDGWHYLFGNFNLGGTLSGRLSSSNPNLQNIPATGSKYAKAIKSCFEAPPGWLFTGLDFNSLEDRISALTTKDPAKLKVYTDGYDGHSMRAYYYFKEQMPTIIDTVASINSIQDVHKDLRQQSKAPTFALTYQGTWKTLMSNCGFPMEVAKEIEERYQELYKVSVDWVSDKLQQATKDGYVTAAFGLRVRTPLLKQVILGNSKTPSSAAREGRSAGNALGQSWCLLNNRAGSEFMGLVRASEFKHDIKPCAQIHDAQYFLIRDDIRAITFANIHLVKAVSWQAHPDIYHPDVKLGGDLSIFHPTWNDEFIIPNGLEGQDILDHIDDLIEQKKKKAKK